MQPAGLVRADFYDGLTARRHAVAVAPSTDGLALVIVFADGGTAPLTWRFDHLRALADQSGAETLTLTVLSDTDDEAPRDPARLVISDPAAVNWLRRTRPGLFRRDIRPGTMRKVAIWLGGATAAVLLMLFVILPGLADFLATRLPLDSEVALGRTAMAQMERLLGAERIGASRCESPEGLAALDRLKDRLVGERQLDYDLALTVFDNDMVNAFAVPGGQIVIVAGLLETVDSADAVAAVLAHEIGHVVARDPVRLSLRAAGSAGILSLVLGDVTGGTALALIGDQLMQASYTRGAEAAADEFAIGLLNEAGISTEGMADFFDQIAGMSGNIPEYLSTHPQSEGRKDRAAANAAQRVTDGQATTPALSEADWAALQAICNTD
ncbi:MAG: M48 family metallopeptidase [Rhodobacteraceae bacterium]|nr:M48 family metallopeptidase [Paracoccaceae bacterium]